MKPLKKRIYGHCLTRINATMAMVTGGYEAEQEHGNHRSTYFIDLTTFEVLENGPVLNKERMNHGCTTFKHKDDDVVIVAGGRYSTCNWYTFGCTTYSYTHSNSWEFLNLSDTELSWKNFDRHHPIQTSLPFRLFYFSLVTSTLGPLAIGGLNQETGSNSREILRLDCDSSPDDISKCTWKKLEMELEVGRYGHVVIPLGDAFAHEICSTNCTKVPGCNMTNR